MRRDVLQMGITGIHVNGAEGRAIEAGTLFEVLRSRAAEHPHREAVRFLERGEVEGPQRALTYAQLDALARAYAGRLQAEVAVGERVLLLHPQGLDFVVGFLACLYAGAVAVPCPTPPRANLARKLDRLCGMVRDCAPTLALCSSEVAARSDQIIAAAPELASLRWMTTTADAPTRPASGSSPDLSSTSLAYLQYTSGSTGSPKGIMVRHQDLMANCRMGAAVMGSEPTTAVLWTPLFHDLGLMSLLHQLWLGGRVVMLSAAAFAQSPIRWLRAIDHFRADRSGGPNFAYDLCVDQIAPQERRDLDLSTWRIAYSGAEPVRLRTLRRFADAFASTGFPPHALAPAYGLAEATVLVTVDTRNAPLCTLRVERSALESRSAIGATPVMSESESEHSVDLVSVGSAILDEQLRIVDPEKCRTLPDDEIGEIWVRGPHIPAGYWGRPEETRQIFGARVENEPEAWLRTGDLGFLHNSELFVTGRLKDLILIRGRNLYPHDIEQAVELGSPELRSCGVAALSLADSAGESLAIVAELHPRRPRAATDVETLDACCERIRREIAERFDVEPSVIALIPAGELPRTTSGKLCRFLARHKLIERSFTFQHLWIAPSHGHASEIAHDLGAAVAQQLDPMPIVVDFLASALKLTADTDVGKLELAHLGIDSLQLVSLRTRLEREVGILLPAQLLFDLWQRETVAGLAMHLTRAWLDRQLRAALSGDDRRPTNDAYLSEHLGL